jgi:glycosyltransferase involved in cell wall biosynthesis
MSGRKVLIITYYWPPSGGVGVQRWLHFALNLKKMGWEPIIYTPENPQFEIQDENLELLAANIPVVKTKIWEPFSFFHKLTSSKEKGSIQQGLALEKTKKSFKDKLFVWIRGNVFVPDARIFWIKPSVGFLKNYISENNIDTIITTGPPHSMHLIGYGLKKGNPALKWVADFRDPWSDWDILEKLQTGKLAMMRHRKLEKNVLRTANAVLTVSSRLAQALDSKYERSRKVDVILNGVTVPKQELSKIPNDEKFIIGYFGMLNEIRDPQILWEALENMCSENADFHQRLEIKLGGIVSGSIKERLENSVWLKGKVIFLGYLSHEEVFDQYRQCNLLLLLLNKTDNAKWILPVKFFEYLSASKPILTLGPADSDLGDILAQYNVGKMLEGDSKSELSEFILSTFAGTYQPEAGDFEKLLKKHSRENQAAELKELIERL